MAWGSCFRWAQALFTPLPQKPHPTKIWRFPPLWQKCHRLIHIWNYIYTYYTWSTHRELWFTIYDSRFHKLPRLFPDADLQSFCYTHGWSRAWAYPGQGRVCVHLVAVQRHPAKAVRNPQLTSTAIKNALGGCTRCNLLSLSMPSHFPAQQAHHLDNATYDNHKLKF